MNSQSVFLDTNTLINFLKGEPLEVELVGDKDIVISEITEMEIQCQPNFNKTQRQELRQFLLHLTIIRLNSEIRENAIKIRLSASMKLMDSIVAASAQFANLPIATCDEKFGSLTTVQVILLAAVDKRK